jgi:hypothetical protein
MNKKNKHIIITRKKIRIICRKTYEIIKEQRYNELLQLNILLNNRLQHLSNTIQQSFNFLNNI